MLWRQKSTDVEGWSRIYEHLLKLPQEQLNETLDETNKDGDGYTYITYKTLTVQVKGKIIVDDVLNTLAKWEYYHNTVGSWFPCITGQRDQAVRPGTIQWTSQNQTYQLGFQYLGPFQALSSNAANGLRIITRSGTTVDSHVELFNGQTGLYLRVISQGSGYTVRVAYRRNSADSNSLFNISNGVIMIARNTNFALYFNRDTATVSVRELTDPPTQNFKFDIQTI
ncbi:uncharacterized protein [Dysidea avara]|uniref:uncharacterized protein n=1 Tax=Dysidea avara TaxID=196820 RepID=UPI0033187623